MYFQNIIKGRLRLIIKRIILPFRASNLIADKIANRINPDVKFYKEKIVLMGLGISLLQYLFLPIFYIIKLINERVIVTNLLKKKKSFSGEIKRVCVYAPWFDKFAGGGETVAAYLAQYFENKYPDAEITILCDDTEGNIIERPATLVEINDKYGTKLQRTKMVMRINGYLNINIYKYYINFMRYSLDFDIFVNCFMSINPSLAAINMHYIHFPAHLGEGISKYMMNVYVSQIDRFIPNSKYTGYWTEKRLKVKNIDVIEPPVLINRLELNKAKKKIIISAGRISPEKNFHEMINCFISNFDKWEGWEYHIIGAKNPKNQWYYDKLVNKIQGYPIKILPNLSKKEFNACFDDAKIYWHAMGFGADIDISPSSAEHFGITVVEAMSLGCVPVVFNAGGPAEIVNDTHSGYTWNNLDELGNITNMLISNPKVMSEYSEITYQNSNRYSSDIFLEKFDKVLEEVISEKLS